MEHGVAALATLCVGIQGQVKQNNEVNSKLTELVLNSMREWRDEWHSRDY